MDKFNADHLVVMFIAFLMAVTILGAVGGGSYVQAVSQDRWMQAERLEREGECGVLRKLAEREGLIFKQGGVK